MIKCNNISKIYGKQIALDHVDLEIKKGEFVAIMGPSGSGKSTLLNIISGIDQPSSGTTLFDGKVLQKIKEKELEEIRRLDMGFVFQSYHILNTLTAKENIALPLTIQKKKKEDIQTSVKEIAQQLEIDQLLNKFPYQMSGGEKQRVAIARAIITHPKVIFADEPTGALDSKNALRLLQILEKHNSEQQTTTVMVTHDTFSASFAKRVVFIKDGKIYHEIEKGNNSRRDFFEQIIKVTSLLGGDFDAA